MIQKARFQNFKALRDVSIDFERLTVLVGPNASGKTSVLEGLNHFANPELRTKARDWISRNPAVVQSLITGATGSEFSIECWDKEGSIQVRWRIEDVLFSGGLTGLLSEVTPRDLNLNFGPAIFLRLNANQLAAPSFSDRPVPSLSYSGYGLASLLAYLALEHPADFRAIVESLQSVIPTVREVRTRRAKVFRKTREFVTVRGKTYSNLEMKPEWGNALEFDTVGANALPAQRMSEGTLVVLGLLASLVSPHRANLLLLDDIDLALHPKAQGELIEQLRKILEQNPQLQIIATSHSPYLLDHLEPQEVRLTSLTPEGFAAVGRLDRHPKFAKWKDEMSPGEFWSLVGENWVVERAVELQP